MRKTKIINQKWGSNYGGRKVLSKGAKLSTAVDSRISEEKAVITPGSVENFTCVFQATCLNTEKEGNYTRECKRRKGKHKFKYL